MRHRSLLLVATVGVAAAGAIPVSLAQSDDGGTLAEPVEITALYSGLAKAVPMEIYLNKVDVIVQPQVNGGPAQTSAEVSIGPGARGRASYYRVPDSYVFVLGLAGQKQPVETGVDVFYPATGTHRVAAGQAGDPNAFSFDAGEAEVTVDAYDVESMAATQDVDMVAGVAGTGSVFSTSRAMVTSAGIEVEAVAEVSGFEMAGTLHIQSVRSTTKVTIGADGVPVVDSTMDISDASVAGTPVAITSEGVTAAGTEAGVPMSTGQQEVNDALEAAGLSVRRLEATDTASAALLITYEHHTVLENPLPDFRMLLGQTSATARFAADAVFADDEFASVTPGSFTPPTPFTPDPASALPPAVPGLPAATPSEQGPRLGGVPISATTDGGHALFVLWLFAGLTMVTAAARRASLEKMAG